MSDCSVNRLSTVSIVFDDGKKLDYHIDSNKLNDESSTDPSSPLSRTAYEWSRIDDIISVYTFRITELYYLQAQ